MKKPILWTIACTLAIIAVLVSWQSTGSLGPVTIALAVLCAGLQWLVYFKNRRNGK